MIKIIDTADTGKTRKLLEACSKDPNGVFVCAHPWTIPDKCMTYNIPLVKAIGYDDYWYLIKNDSIDTKIVRNIYIDELEKFVKFYVPFVVGYTLTKE